MIKKVNDIFKKYLTQKVRNIISIFIIIFGLAYIINYSFYKPSYINKYIATNIYRTAANSNFTDERFYACVIDSYNAENNTSLPYTTSLTTTQLASMTKLSCSDNKVTSVNGLRFMSKLKVISLDNELSSLDFSSISDLERLELISNYSLVNLNVSNNKKMVSLYVYDADLSSLDLAANINLEHIMLYDCGLNSINLGNNTKLNWVEIKKNPLSSINLSGNTGLEYLFLENNNLSELDLSNNTELYSFGISNYENDEFIGTNSFKTIDLSKLSKLGYFHANNVGLEQINFDSNTELKNIDISHNNLSTQINFTKNTKLQKLNVSYNSLTKLNLSENTELYSLLANDNELTSISLVNNTNLSSDPLYFNIKNNNFYNVLTKYVHGTGSAHSAVNLPSTLNDDVVWESSNTHVAECDLDGKILSAGEGEVDIVGTSPYYTTKTHFYSFRAKSDNYSIADDGGVIFVGTETNMDTVKNNIEISDFISDQITVSLSNDKKSINLSKNDTVLKTMQIVGVKVYDNYKTKFGADYVYSATHSDPTNTFECTNCTASVNNNYLNIKFVNDGITYTHEYKIIYLTTNYTVYGGALNEGGYIYVGNEGNQQVLENFRASNNGNVTIKDGKLEISYKGVLLDSYTLKRITIADDVKGNYIMGSNYIFTGFDEFNKEKIQVSDSLMSTTLSNGELIVRNQTAQLAKYSILGLKSSTLSHDNTNIYVDAGMSYSDFVSKIEKTGYFTTQLFKGSTQIRSGNLEDGMIYKILYNSVNIKNYVIDATSYYVDLTDYDVEDNYIFLTGNANINVSQIDTRNCTVRLNQDKDKLEVVQDNDVVETYQIVKITDKYLFLKDYIYVGAASDANILLNIDVPKGLKKEISNDKLRIMLNGEEIWSRTLIKLRSESPFIINEEQRTIFVADADSDDIDEINNSINLTINYGTAEVCDAGGPRFCISFPNSDTPIFYTLYGYSSEKYDLRNKYLYIGYSEDGTIETENDSISRYNTEVYVQNNQLTFRHPDDDSIIFNKYDILYYSFNDPSETEKMRNVDGKIYTRDYTDYEIIDKIAFSSGDMSASISNNKLVITYLSKKIDEIDLIRVSSAYNCVNGIIFLGTSNFDKTNVINGEGEYDADNNQFIVKATSDGEALETYKILGGITFDDLLYRDKIILPSPISYSEFVNEKINIEPETNITIEVLDGDATISSGMVQAGMKLVIKLNNVEVCRLDISDEFVIFASSLKKTNDDNIVHRILPGSSALSIYNLISTSGKIEFYDISGKTIGLNDVLKTGDEFRIQLINNTHNYKICVVGDVLGTGELSIDDAKKITEHVINGDDDNDENENKYFQLSADYNGDGEVKMNDVVKIVRALKEING